MNSFQYLRVMGLKSISDHGWAINIFGHCRAINIFGLGRAIHIFLYRGNLDFWQSGQLGLWVTWVLGDLSFGWLELWVTWTLSNLGLDNLGNLGIGHLRWLGLWTSWVTWTLGNLCIEKLDSRFNGWKYFRLVYLTVAALSWNFVRFLENLFSNRCWKF